MNVWHLRGFDCDKISVFMLAKQNICKLSHGLWLTSIKPSIKRFYNSVYMPALEVQTIFAF